MAGTDAVVPSFPAGYGPLPADLAAWVTTPFSFLSSKVMFRAQLQGSQAVSGMTLAQFGNTAGDILEDPYGGWSNTGSGSQATFSWLCPPGCSGWYEVTMTAFTTNPATATDQVQTVLFLNGVNYSQAAAGWGVNGHNSGECGVAQVPLLGGYDYLQMDIFSTAATNTPAVAGQYPTMEVAWISL